MRAARGHPLRQAGWDATLDTLADRFAECIRTHGPDSVAFYVSGQLLTEEYYVFNKLAKGLVGTNNIDTNSRLCMSSAVTGYKATLGADAPPACYEDIDHADLVFIAGSNTAWAHPVLFRRIEAAKERNPALKIIVVDPRRTATADFADLHLAIEPGTDVALFHGLLHVMLWEEWIDADYVAAHTSGFAELKTLVREYTPAAVAGICGIRTEDLVQAARWFGEAEAVLSLYCQGLNQSSSGTAKNAALINLHLATGQIGRPGAGPFSLTGQPNAMGGREVGGMATLMSGHRDLANAEHRAEVAALWGVDDVPAKPGQDSGGNVRGARRRRHQDDLDRVHESRAVAAGPGGRARGARPGGARRIAGSVYRYRDGRVRRRAAARDDVGRERRHGDELRAADLARARGGAGARRGKGGLADRRRFRAAAGSAAAARVSCAHADAVSLCVARGDISRACRDDRRARSRHHGTLLRRARDPRPAAVAVSGRRRYGRQRLYDDGVFATPDGRARFAAAPYVPVAEKPDARYPFRLNTGRLRDQWHGMSRTGTVAQLFQNAGEPRLQLHRSDLARRGIAAGDLVRVESKRGRIVVPVEASAELKPGHAFLPMHWGSASLGGEGALGVNALTTPARCPISQQPELKHAAVRVTKAELPWRLAVFGYATDSDALAMRSRIAAAARIVSVRQRHADRPRPAGRAVSCGGGDARGPALLDRVDDIFGLDADVVARYDDATRGIGRRVRVDEGKLVAVRLSGDTAAESWLREWLLAEREVAALRTALLMPTAQAPRGFAPRGRVVCTCFDIAESLLRTSFAAAEGTAESALSEVRGLLKCGTNCGSCLPELKRLATETRLGARARAAYQK